MLLHNSSAFGLGQVQSENTLPPTSNTGVYSSKNTSGRGVRATNVSSGIDWLSFSVYGGWPALIFDDLAKRFNDAKVAAKAKKPYDAVIQVGEGDSVMMASHGYSNGFDAEWCLDWQGTTIGIAPQRVAAPGQPSACISIPSMPLMLHGHRNRYEGVLGVMKALGFDLSYVGRPSRFDVCVDLANVCPSEFPKFFRNEQYIVKARRWICPPTESGERQVEVGKRGKSSTFLQIYDKFFEVFCKPEKMPVMLQRWGGVWPKCATRVEFRSGGKSTVMERFAVKDVDDLFAKMPLICEYLPEAFCRLTTEPVDRENKNQSKATIHPVWEQVMNGLREFAGDPEQGWVVPPKRLGSDVKGLKLQGMGCLVNAFVMTVPDASAEKFKEWFADLVDELDGDEKITRAIKIKTATDPYRKPTDDADIPF